MADKKQIVFIGSGIPDMLTKMGVGLKEKGYETVFISLVKNEELDFLKEGYDKVISFDAKFFKISISNLPKIFFYGLRKIPRIIKSLYEIKRLKPYVIVVVTPPNWLFRLSRKYLKNAPFIYFPFDIRSFGYKDMEDAISKGIPKFELEAEKWAFKNADGIIHKGSPDELKYLNKDLLGDIKIKYPDVYFFPYCLEELIVPINKNKLSKDGNIHVVCVGHIPVDEKWWNGANELTKQDIYVHLYSKTNNFTKEEEKQRVKNNLSNNLKNKFIVLHESVSQKELSKEISKYDYGAYTFSLRSGKDYEMTTGNKIASYLEAGLPVICPAQFKTSANLLKKYKAGVIVKPSEFRKIRKILEKKNPDKLVKRVILAREELRIRKHIPRLEKFFEKVVKTNKQH